MNSLDKSVHLNYPGIRMLSKNPTISVIIPVLSINSFITEENLPALSAQRYKNLEVIVLPNLASPQDENLRSQYPFLRIQPTPGVSRPAEKRNIGARVAKGEILAFLDDDAYPTTHWLEHAVPLFTKKMSAVVCGPGLTPPNATRLERVFEAVLTSKLGSGGIQFRFTPSPSRFVDDYPSMNFLIRKEIFNQVGGFELDYWPGEDSKLSEGVVHKLKQRMYYSPDVLVYHHRRPSLKSFLKQHAQYGMHRGAFFGHGDRNSTRLSYLIPTFFTVYLFGLILSGLAILALRYPVRLEFIIFSCVPLILYILWQLITTLMTLKKSRNLIVTTLTPMIIFSMHLTYGVAFIKGLFRRKKLYGTAPKILRAGFKGSPGRFSRAREKISIRRGNTNPNH
ncbi:hypothetical protein A3A70_01435 [candidate division WWE3 bacterium RIFCSPLOWO2_01_FULL_42_11]|uniref:Glycosyltransferase 2-like domain-containing protein n=1 Tax=candidate division WWE3 bacterium RIFCSPLOWO2_01_FULL_42_11 TaxID=1802627 RepID=A0A1F4VNF6_UNCKA|nr:MAG: hypothetical protein A3A70_01435 [candidate division WWE3 bacterium RIFCSPLOWO2_01_FULL_42_11]